MISLEFFFTGDLRQCEAILAGPGGDQVQRLEAGFLGKAPPQGLAVDIAPATHKTEHHGRQRVVFIGPQAQEILRPYSLRDTETYCFHTGRFGTQTAACARTKYAKRPYHVVIGRARIASAEGRRRLASGTIPTLTRNVCVVRLTWQIEKPASKPAKPIRMRKTSESYRNGHRINCATAEPPKCAAGSARKPCK